MTIHIIRETPEFQHTSPGRCGYCGRVWTRPDFPLILPSIHTIRRKSVTEVILFWAIFSAASIPPLAVNSVYLHRATELVWRTSALIGACLTPTGRCVVAYGDRTASGSKRGRVWQSRAKILKQNERLGILCRPVVRGQATRDLTEVRRVDHEDGESIQLRNYALPELSFHHECQAFTYYYDMIPTHAHCVRETYDVRDFKLPVFRDCKLHDYSASRASLERITLPHVQPLHPSTPLLQSRERYTCGAGPDPPCFATAFPLASSCH